MDYTTIWAAVSSLGGALIGAGAVIKSQQLQWRRDRAADADVARTGAVEELLLRALSLDLVSHQMTTVVSEFTSLGGQVNRLVRIVAPLDFSALLDKLNREAEALNRASAQIWMTTDQQTVKLTNAVTSAAMDVVTAHHATPKSGRVRRHLVGLVRGRSFGDEHRIQEARQRLAEARKALVDHTRHELRLPPVDLFALPDEPNAHE